MKTNLAPFSVKLTLVLSALALVLAMQPAAAVILLGSGDPAYNTTAPDGALAGSGWQYQGSWGGVLGTAIAPNYFIAAHHVGGSVGQTFTYQGVTYTTTAYWDDPNSDFRIWKVSGTFPTYAPLYPLTDEDGKLMVVIGRGTQRGSEVAVTLVQTNYFTNSVALQSLGMSQELAQEEFPKATFQGITMTVNLKSLGISKKLAQKEFPKATFQGDFMTVDLQSLGISQELAQQQFPKATFCGITMTVNLGSPGVSEKLARQQFPEASFQGHTMTVDLASLGVSKRLAQREFPQAIFRGNSMTVNLRHLGSAIKLAQMEFPEATFQGDTMTVELKYLSVPGALPGQGLGEAAVDGNTMAGVSATVTTNAVPRGWKAGASDGVMRWGQSKVTAGGCYIVGAFDKNGGPDQAYLSNGDSSGAVFIQNNGVWKLAGINYGVDGPFGVTPTDSFYGAIFDESGLYIGGTLIPNDGQIYPACFYATRISYRLPWIQSIISQ